MTGIDFFVYTFVRRKAVLSIPSWAWPDLCVYGRSGVMPIQKLFLAASIRLQYFKILQGMFTTVHHAHNL